MSDSTDAPASRRRLVALSAATAAVVGLALAVVATSRATDADDPIADAIALLREEDEFDSSREAVASFADVYRHLVDATKAFPKDCGSGADAARCLALNQAAGWSLAFSPASGHCTQPAVQEGRLALLAHLHAVSTSGGTSAPPPLPPIPGC